MKEFSYTITDPVGIHARPAGLLVKKLEKFKSAITIARADTGASCDGKKLLALMKHRAKQHDSIIVKAEGEDEAAAIETARAYLSQNL
jgi:phosphocarrier protein